MKRLILFGVGLFFLSCQSAIFIAEKDSWISIRTLGSDKVYYCERVEINKKMIPICTPAMRMDFFKSQEK